MKTILFAIILTFSYSLAFAAPVAGKLHRGKKDLHIVLEGNHKKYRLFSLRSDANIALNKLSSGDYIIGTGDIDEKNLIVELQALDYVGLKKILGLWYNNKTVMNFKNFSELSVYPIAGSLATAGSSPSTEIRYSMAPFNGNQWAIFLSNSQATVFATIELGFSTAKLSIYDSQNGETTDSFILTRWSK